MMQNNRWQCQRRVVCVLKEVDDAVLARAPPSPAPPAAGGGGPGCRATDTP